MTACDLMRRVPDALPQPVQAVLDAANAHDVVALLRAFTPDGAVDDWGRVFRGPDEIRGWSEREFTGVNVTLEVTGVATEGEDTVVTAQVGGDGFNGPSHFRFAIADGRVARMTIRA
jgi:ketosteroid isomerase-like protein